MRTVNCTPEETAVRHSKVFARHCDQNTDESVHQSNLTFEKENERSGGVGVGMEEGEGGIGGAAKRSLGVGAA